MIFSLYIFQPQDLHEVAASVPPYAHVESALLASLAKTNAADPLAAIRSVPVLLYVFPKRHYAIVGVLIRFVIQITPLIWRQAAF